MLQQIKGSKSVQFSYRKALFTDFSFCLFAKYIWILVVSSCHLLSKLYVRQNCSKWPYFMFFVHCRKTVCKFMVRQSCVDIEEK